jgi:hypothetical protein
MYHFGFEKRGYLEQPSKSPVPKIYHQFWTQNWWKLREREREGGAGEVKATGVQPRYVEGTEISNESCAVSVSFSCAAAAA